LKPFGSEEMTGISPIFPLAIRIILALVIFWSVNPFYAWFFIFFE
jgi:hypothetical protein